MITIANLFAPKPYVNLPFDFVGWVGWFFLLGLLVWVVMVWWEPFRDQLQKKWLWFIGLALFSPVATLLLAIRVPNIGKLPLPGLPSEPIQPFLLILFAIPWVLGGGLLGRIPALFLGLLSGFQLALWGTHSLFSPLEIGGMAFLFSVIIRQNYRTRFYQLLRHPIIAALFLGISFLPVFILSTFFNTQGGLAIRLDYALTEVWWMAIARGVELLIAGLVAEVIFLSGSKIWYQPRTLQPSPEEASLETRFLHFTLPMILVLVIVLILGDWMVAGAAARKMIRDRLSSTAEVAAESLPYLQETGQSLILSVAQPDLANLSGVELSNHLAAHLRSIPYFRQFFVINAQKETMGGYPESDFSQIRLSDEEKLGIDLALKGVLVQTYAIEPLLGENSAQLSFIAAINNETGQTVGVVIGRTDLNTNPFTQPALEALKAVADDGGEGIILDENQNILYHAVTDSPLVIFEPYQGKLAETSAFYEDISPTGTRQLVYYQPVLGRPWSVILKLPAEQAQKIALDIAIPLLVILLVFAVLAYVLIRLSMRTMTGSLQTLAGQTTLIAQGQLSTPLPYKGVDEIGRLGKAFEQMRVSLKARLDELNRLLLVSQGVAANLEVEESIRPILEAALGEQAVSARAVLISEVRSDLQEDKPAAFGIGPLSDVLASLDQQIFDLMRSQELLTIPNTSRVRRISIPGNSNRPYALIALALRYENTYYGTLWVAYDQIKNFSEEEVRFLTTLASEAALAAANARLFASAEIGRRRLEAVISSTPEPVLVFDEKDRLLLLNPAVLQVHGLVLTTSAGKSINDVIASQELAEMLAGPLEDRISTKEITMGNGKIYHASVAPVMGEGQQVGKVCILRDITHYKELDSIKSDFVATVSHDLRSPLTLMRGYATMMLMVGDLNDQQKGYIAKIISGVDNMTRLVNSLLDLGRIEAGIGLKVEEISPEEVVNTVIRNLQPQATQKSIQLEAEFIDTDKVWLEADPALLQQGLLNLVENAIKYTRVNGAVKVKVSVKQGKVIFEVHDSGIGIAPLDMPRLFEKFYRSGRREAYEQRGSGLGLAIVKSIVERHQGKVNVESQLGKGSTFTVEIPLRQQR